MDFMGIGGQGYNYPGDDDEHQTTNMMIHGNNSSSSSPSSSSVSHHGNSRGPPLTTEGSPWEYSPIHYEKQQQQRQHFPWAWPAVTAEKRGDEEVETEEEEEGEEIKWTTGINEGAAARSARGVDNSGAETRVGSVEREHMFDKVVTPSDVGKLNRLVIPKQHAEKYFPLDSSTNEKGLLLNFEDRSGKPWRFRYSYWNSSQSYVITKGWSRFVKEKRLDAGDVVSFHRGVGEAGKARLYIDWRRRPDAPEHSTTPGSFFSTFSFPPHPHFASNRRPPSQLSWTPPLFWRPPPPSPPPPPTAAAATGTWDHYAQQLHPNYNNQILGHPPPRHHPRNSSSSFGSGSYRYDYLGMRPVFYHQQLGPTTTPPQQQQQYQQQQQQEEEVEIGNIRVQQVVQDDQEEGGADEPMVFESVPVVQGMAVSAPKKLRLFGVNMECPMPQSECEGDVALSSSSPTTTTTNQYHHRPALPTILASQQHPHISSTSSYRLYHGTPLLNKGKASASSSSLDFKMLN